MARTVLDVQAEAIETLSLDYTMFGYATEAEFLAWVGTVVDRVHESFSLKVGASLDILNFYEAVLYETMARIIERRIGRAYAAASTAQNISVGPISISSASSSATLKDWSWNAKMYHDRAAARLMAMGIGRRKALLKVFGANDCWERLDVNHPVPFNG